jgi:hypothetical protein
VHKGSTQLDAWSDYLPKCVEVEFYEVCLASARCDTISGGSTEEVVAAHVVYLSGRRTNTYYGEL